ncbi:hypothetical protein BGX20_009772 [Mortierella sp. AD010]|nr:hypothetical protein BGX20_009772 [Mortierella sp. AD010]
MSDGPVVMIVGGGIGGIMLGMLFERLNLQYHIFERATELRSLGSVMTVGPNILPVFEQLGLLEEVMKLSLPCPGLSIYNHKLDKLGNIMALSAKETGYDSVLFARPRLYELMKKQIPPNKISLGKKVLTVKEKDDKVLISCSDGSIYEGDLLIGADGAHSAVRQNIFKTMDELDILPKDDLESFHIGYINMVGVATVDSEKYPQTNDGIAHFVTVLGKDNTNWNVAKVPDNQICWALGVQLSPTEAKVQHFRNSEWGPEANETMLEEFGSKPCPWGGVMKDIFDATPKNLISKVFLEEKIFKTWHHSRAVLIGDGSMLPSAGQGAINAMQDAVILVNCLHDIGNEYTVENLTVAFQEYYRQRYQRSADLVKGSNTMGKIMSGQTWSERIIRHTLFNFIPNSVQAKISAKVASYRPQITWLPLIENRGTTPVLPQEKPREVLVKKA